MFGKLFEIIYYSVQKIIYLNEHGLMEKITVTNLVCVSQ